jgi:predicted nucleotidyltransferase
VAWLALFGSALRAAFHPDSDVDARVRFQPGTRPGWFGLADMEAELSGMFGRRLDLRIPQELSRYFREEVTANAEPLSTAG